MRACPRLLPAARLNSATNNLGTLDELYVIAAAVIGGTSFAGGIGTIYGAILGALVMQSLQTGMVLIGFDAAIQQIVVGTVLVVAVWIDSVYRRPRQMRSEKMSSETSGTPLVEIKDLSIAFGGIKAVDQASVDLSPGEVVAILGHNGAGKSTLIKVLSGGV